MFALEAAARITTGIAGHWRRTAKSFFARNSDLTAVCMQREDSLNDMTEELEENRKILKETKQGLATLESLRDFYFPALLHPSQLKHVPLHQLNNTAARARRPKTTPPPAITYSGDDNKVNKHSAKDRGGSNGNEGKQQRYAGSKTVDPSLRERMSRPNTAPEYANGLV